MKLLQRVIALSLVISTLISCDTAPKFSIQSKSKSVLDDEFQISIRDEKNTDISKVLFYVNGEELKVSNNKATIQTNNFGVGKHLISAMVYYGDNKNKKINSTFEVLAKTAPEVYSYKIINTYPHDQKAYTQGLEYHDGFLYETTGQYGTSSLRKVELKTGKVLKQIDLEDRYFGEGMTIFNDEIFFLTWKSSKGFVYDLKSFEFKKEFTYNKSKEGWGLTHNDKHLIKSDGTHKIWFLDAATQKELKNIQAYTNNRAVGDLNELELINGQIFANKWQQNVIVMINPTTGVVEGIADLEGLKKEVEKTQKLEPQDEVLNGIAYDSENNRLFVTGKRWGKLFEIELIKE